MSTIIAKFASALVLTMLFFSSCELYRGSKDTKQNSQSTESNSQSALTGFDRNGNQLTCDAVQYDKSPGLPRPSEEQEEFAELCRSQNKSADICHSASKGVIYLCSAKVVESLTPKPSDKSVSGYMRSGELHLCKPQVCSNGPCARAPDELEKSFYNLCVNHKLNAEFCDDENKGAIYLCSSKLKGSPAQN